VESGLNPVRSTLRQCKTIWLESWYRKPLSIALKRPVVSLAFDDVPISAYQNGIPILKRQNVKATFYVALGLRSDGGEEYLGPSEITALHHDGHEIACHTYSHYRLSTGDSDGLAADAEKNQTKLRQLLNNGGPRSFAFPFGDVSLPAKKKLQGSYQSLRTSRQGINHGSVDLNCLKAYSLGADNATRPYISGLLDRVEQKNGWLILYTHGVLPNAGRYDIRPETLEWILRACSERRFQTLPVADAIQSISNSSLSSFDS